MMQNLTQTLPRLILHHYNHIKPIVPENLHKVFRLAFNHRLTRRAFNIYDRIRINRVATKLFGPQYQRSLRKIEIDITYACNMSCFNCNRSIQQAPTGEHMSMQQIEMFIHESKEKRIKWERIRLLGGEPTLHRHFFEILDLLRAYKREFSPDTRIEVTTNGHGKKVQQIIKQIPADIHINNTSKQSDIQPEFVTFNVAPLDQDKYRSADFRNGCWIVDECGFGLSPSGYYPCAVAGSIDRIFGWNLGRQSLPNDTDKMEDLLEQFCRHCGHFKRHLEEPVFGPVMSTTWRDAYERYRRSKPKLSKYGMALDAPPAGCGTPTHESS
jgi:hypothetical protein